MGGVIHENLLHENIFTRIIKTTGAHLQLNITCVSEGCIVLICIYLAHLPILLHPKAAVHVVNCVQQLFANSLVANHHTFNNYVYGIMVI